MAISKETKKLISDRIPIIGAKIIEIDVQIVDLERVVQPKNDKIDALNIQKTLLKTEKTNIEKDLQGVITP